MVELSSIDLVKDEVTFADHSTVTFEKFYDAFERYWDNRVAGETLSPFYMERFMKRGSSRGLKQLLDNKKAEGFMEGAWGKKMDANMMKIIIIAVIVGAGALIAIVVIKQLGLI